MEKAIAIITARGGFDKEVINITHDRLKKANMDIFDKYFNLDSADATAEPTTTTDVQGGLLR